MQSSKMAHDVLLLVLLATAATAAASDDITIGRLHSFRWQPQQADDDNSILQVCYNSTTEDTQTPIELLTYEGVDNTEYSVQASESDETSSESHDDLMCGSFDVSESTLDFTAAKEYQVVSGDYIFRANIILSMKPGVLEGYSNLGLGRVVVPDSESYTLSNCLVTDEQSSACYLSTCTSPCFDAADTGESTTILVCDDIKFTPIDEQVEYKNVTINYDLKTLTLNQETNDVDPILEVLLYYPDLFEDVDPSNDCAEVEDMEYVDCPNSICEIKKSENGTSEYSLILVEVDSEGIVVGWDKLVVQDLAVTAEPISKDTIKISWTPSDSLTPFRNNERSSKVLRLKITEENQMTQQKSLRAEKTDPLYQISLSPEIEGFTSLTVPCRVIPDYDSADVQLCQEFITHVPDLLNTPGNTEYTLTVFDEENDLQITTIVKIPENLPEQAAGDLSIMRHTVDSSESYFITTVCYTPTTASPESNTYSTTEDPFFLVITDEQNSDRITSTTNSQKSSDDDDICFADISLPEDLLNTKYKLRVMMYKLEDDVYSSDQLDTYLFAPSYEQVSSNVALATWYNGNGGRYSDPNKGDDGEMECSVGKTCHYYALSTESSPFSLSEELSNDPFQQICTVDLAMSSIDDMVIESPFTVRSDGKLLVCFNPGFSSKTTRYALGLEQDNGVFVTTDDDAQQEEGPDGQTCLVTPSAVTLGAYVDLWAVVTAYDTTDTILEAGRTVYKDLFLAESAEVLVLALEDDTSVTYNILTSWELVDHSENLGDYTIQLLDINGNFKEETEPVSSNSHTFTLVEPGAYTVCVSVAAASEPEVSVSQCSQIVNALDLEQDAPPKVNTVEIMHTDEAARFSWGMDSADLQKVAFFLITWEDASTTSKFRDTAKQQYQLVPGSKSSVDLVLDDGEWSVCLTAISGNKPSDDEECATTIVASGDSNVPPPTDLLYEDGFVTWTKPACATLLCKYTYHVEWQQDSTLRYNNPSTPSQDLTELPPGWWLLTVRTVDKDKYGSDLADLNVLITGLTGQFWQTSLHQVTVSWWEISEIVDDSEHTYELRADDVPVAEVSCSGGSGDPMLLNKCQATISNVTSKSIVKISSQDDTNINWELKVDVEDIPSVTDLSKSLKSITEGSVSWSCVDGASKYNVSLYDSDNVFQYNTFQTLPCSIMFKDIEDLQGYSVFVQTCIEKNAAFSKDFGCGDKIGINFGNLPLPEEDSSSNVLTIVLSSVAAGLVVIVIIVAIVYRKSIMQSRKPKDTPPMDDTMSLQSRAEDGTISLNNQGTGINNDAFMGDLVKMQQERQLNPEISMDGGRRFQQHPAATPAVANALPVSSMPNSNWKTSAPPSELPRTRTPTSYGGINNGRISPRGNLTREVPSSFPSQTQGNTSYPSAPQTRGIRDAEATENPPPRRSDQVSSDRRNLGQYPAGDMNPYPPNPIRPSRRSGSPSRRSHQGPQAVPSRRDSPTRHSSSRNQRHSSQSPRRTSSNNYDHPRTDSKHNQRGRDHSPQRAQAPPGGGMRRQLYELPTPHNGGERRRDFSPERGVGRSRSIPRPQPAGRPTRMTTDRERRAPTPPPRPRRAQSSRARPSSQDPSRREMTNW